jgi:hypothetical protein
MPQGSDVRIYYEDVDGNKITRTLAMRYANGGAFEGDINSGRRIMIEESK